MSLADDLEYVNERLVFSPHHDDSQATDAMARIAAALAGRIIKERQYARGLADGTIVRYNLVRNGEVLKVAPESLEGVTLQPQYLHCFVCGVARSLEVREACGHDTDGPGGRRWYCSRECFEATT